MSEMKREEFLNDFQNLHAIIEKYVKDKNYTPSQVLSFLSSTFVGTMAMNGFSEEFFDATCERMKESFKEKRKSFGSAPV